MKRKGSAKNTPRANVYKTRENRETERYGRIYKSVFLLALTVIVYIPALHSDWIWDDDVLIAQNPIMNDSRGILYYWLPFNIPHEYRLPDYLPLSFSTLWVEWQLYKNFDHPAYGFHLTNVLMHGLGAILLWYVLLRLRIPGALAIAVLFAVHPVNAASVAWIVERKNTLSLLFFLLTILCYLNYEQLKRSRWYILSLVMFVLSLLSKSSVILLPPVLLLCLWWQRRSAAAGAAGNWLRGRDIRAILPFFALSIIMAGITIYYQNTGAIGQAAIFKEGEGTFAWRLAMAGSVPWFYLFKDIWPLELLSIYPRWSIDTQNPLWYLPGLAIICGLTALIINIRRSWAQAVFFAFAFFLIMLFPVMGFFDMYYMIHSLTADHWQYLSMIAVPALIVGGITHLSAGWPRNRKIILTVLFVAVAAGLSLKTWRQSSLYKNQITLWSYNLAKNPDNWMGQYNMGTELLHEAVMKMSGASQREQFERTVDHLKRAMELKPDHSHTYNNLCLALHYMNQQDEAEKACQTAIELDPSNLSAQVNLGMVYNKTERLAKAAEQYQKALELAPDTINLLTGLGAILIRDGRFEQASRTMSEAIERNPDVADLYNLRGEAFYNLKQYPQAREDFESSLRLSGGRLKDSFLRLASTLLDLDDTTGALEMYSRLLLTEPDNTYARYMAGMLMAETGQDAPALEALMLVDQQGGGNMNELQATLATLLEKAGRPAEAIGRFRRALAIRPDRPHLMMGLARALAHPNAASARNITEAIDLAEQVCRMTNYRQAVPLETLAEVYAHAGRSLDAISTQQRAVDLLARTADSAAQQAARQRLLRYKSAQ